MTRDISVLRLAKATGATRQTVYNWLTGGEIANAYKTRVEELTDILQNVHHTEDAWRTICQRFNLEF